MTMRIGTWNVEYAAGQDKYDRRLRRLREMACDIRLLTETHERPQWACRRRPRGALVSLGA